MLSPSPRSGPPPRAGEAIRIIGIDPGTRAAGWGIIEQIGTARRCVGFGVIHPADGPLCDRLVTIDDELERVLETHRPTMAAMESIFFSRNAQSAAKLGHARGVLLLRLRRWGLVAVELAPAQVKRAVVGRGAADKLQVARVVAAALSLSELPPSDAADALAVALTGLATVGFSEALAQATAHLGASAKPRGAVSSGRARRR